ncbi:hypothetical protein E0Z10_g10522 [Xylaria hypoxylon]|uniref:Heterokaryon incompatibility domain-containing protein n=1 Tax=Xylaria hypoxylon TaxID=37992 RepID=A0A4Z0YNK6_9PEZI|nr:hypothetical protein E0Z10_g10522 [Xylaria hypoxylon]
MQNDLKQQGAPLSPYLYTRLASLSKHLIDRREAQEWAFRDLKFLIYDDTDVRVNGYDSDDEEGMTEYAMKMSIDSTTAATDADGQDQGIVPIQNINEIDEDIGPSTKRRTDVGTHTNTDDSACRICSSCPEFPHNRKIRKFRLFKPFDAFPERFRDHERIKSVDVCAHYVAVSYCWPPMTDSVQDKDNSVDERMTYQVRDLDGTVRRSRALDDVLDRAVDVANTFGLRMLWIDQECLPQPTEDSHEDEKYEQQLGVQAMDIVYHRAAVTAGLHDVTVTDPLQMNAIIQLMDMNWNVGPPQFNSESLNLILDFLDAVSRDRWNTRAWVVQEALSAGVRLMIILRRGRGIPYLSSNTRWSGPASQFMPKHTLDNTSRGMSSEIVCIQGDKFRVIVQNAKLLIERAFIIIGQALCQFNGSPSTIIQRARPILDAAEALYPPLAIPPDVRGGPISLVGGYNYGHRRTVDGAGALTLLNTRECRYQEDRVAIFANMCGYDIRLDSRAVADSGSLREGLMVLALLNGDLSLLVPEAYRCPELEFPDSDDTKQQLGSRWMFPFDNYAQKIDHVSPRNFNLHKLLVPPNFTKRGVSLPSYVWQVEDELDLSPIKYQWEETWEELKCLRAAVVRLEKETLEEYGARRQLIAEHFAKHTNLRQAKKDLFLTTELPPTSRAWDGIGKDGVTVTQFVSAHRVQGVPEMRRIISEIIFGILRYLFNSAETDPRARGLATSIWQSLRVGSVDDRMDLPDEVGEELFDHPSVVEKPFKTLQLDISPDGEYSQLWFIDRIMQHGTLWIGRYHQVLSGQRITYPLNSDQVERRKRRHSSLEKETEIVEKEEDSTLPLVISKGKEPMPIEVGDSDESKMDKFSHSIIRRQMRRVIMAELMSAQTPASHGVVPGTMTTFAEVVATGMWSEKAEERRINDLISTFNVSGPCIVSTPYNADWEMLPRPEFRSMSVCWVIEPVDSACSSPPPETETSKISELADSIEQPLTACGSGETVKQVSASDGGDEQVYRVLSKVKGLWKLMDPPQQRVTIV